MAGLVVVMETKIKNLVHDELRKAKLMLEQKGTLNSSKTGSKKKSSEGKAQTEGKSAAPAPPPVPKQPVGPPTHPWALKTRESDASRPCVCDRCATAHSTPRAGGLDARPVCEKTRESV